MSRANRWLVKLATTELDNETRVDARLVMDDNTCWQGHGKARRNPHDMNVTEIGEKIAVARALSDLAHMLLGSAAAEIEDISHERARLHL